MSRAAGKTVASKAGRARKKDSQVLGTANDSLSRYRDKRNFDITPEPAGELPPRATHTRAKKATTAPDKKAAGVAPARYVIQKHWARRLHYDFRLEIDGTMKSWAVPKGPSLDPSIKRMAVHVEDHPIAYNDFEGTIPAGQYGAGEVIIWDRGHWKAEGDPADGYAAGKLKFELSGVKLQGRWALIRMGSRSRRGSVNGGGSTSGGDAASKEDGKQQDAWLLIKEKDDHARAEADYDITRALPDSVGRTASGGTAKRAKLAKGGTAPAQPAATGQSAAAGKAGPAARQRTAAAAAMPTTLEPQLATRLSTAPTSGDWLYEVKYDGYRILTRINGGRPRLYTRNGHDWTHRLPTLEKALKRAALPDGWYDGEIVVPGDDARPDFQALQNALDRSDTHEMVYYLFDLPWLGADDLRRQPLHERRAHLEAILEYVDDPALRLSVVFETRARDMLQSACRLGLEGVIGKKRHSPYSAGRSGHWIKLKCGERQEFVIGGYTDPKGSRTGLGALLLGYYDEAGALRYAGNVGSGFSDTMLADLHGRLRALRQKQPPFSDPPRSANTHWVRPELAAEVSFSQWTQTGRVRHAVFQGLRTDKPATLMKKEHAKTITSPERVVDAKSDTRKGDVAAYYERIAPLILPHLKDRPVAMLRAPDGLEGELFFQKHLDAAKLEGIMQLDPALDPGHDPLVVVDSAAGLTETAQLNVIEFHTWNAVRSRIDRPDRICFDLDPGQGVKWPAVQQAALLLRSFLQELGLPAWLKTSGGKGLHVVVPIVRRYDWDTAKGFSRAIVQHMADVLPKQFSAKSGPRNRVGKIFIDYLRNGFGATTVCAWSLRARPGMGVSVPVAWEELDSLESGDHWTIRNIDERLETGNEPWAEYAKAAAALGPGMKRLGWQPPDDT